MRLYQKASRTILFLTNPMLLAKLANNRQYEEASD